MDFNFFLMLAAQLIGTDLALQHESVRAQLEKLGYCEFNI